MPSGTIDSGKYIPSNTSDSGGGTFGKFGNWIKNNKNDIIKTSADVADVIGDMNGNKKWNTYADIARAAASGLERMDDKNRINGLNNIIAEQNARQFGNRFVAYSDFPRIHYGRKPTTYTMYQKRNKFDDGEEAKIEQLKRKIEYQQRQGSTGSKKKKKSKK